MADSEPSLVALALGNAAYAFSKVQPLLPVYVHMILASLFPIYAASHASLTRPSTAAKPTKKGKKKTRREGEDEDTDSEDEAEEPTHEMEGLTNKDIILFPLFAGIALATLYFLIKWLEDPTVLNQALNAYFAIFGVAAVTTLVSDVLDIGHSIIFPRRHALAGTLYHVHASDALAVPVAGTTSASQTLSTPLPGFLARIPLSQGAKAWLWADRAMPSRKWTLKLHTHGALFGKLRISAHTMVGAAVALSTILYFNLVDKPWYLTNLLGFSFCYGSLQMISPTTFFTGSAILVGLFFYDIYMVFFTPLMVTVATKLDVPIKLMFPKPGGRNTAAMLGLGDIVIPGLMVGLALRFDLYLFYLRRQKRVSAKTGESGEDEETVVKAEYYPLAGRWSDHFWTHSFMGRRLWSPTSPAGTASRTHQGEEGNEEAPFTFPKVYFNAALVGYVGGLVATLCALHLMNHAQPALLWLVPGVLISLWSTALVRGELGLMWNYSEEIVEEEGDADGKGEKKRTPEQGSTGGDKHDRKNEKAERAKTKSRRSDRELLSFSIEAPRKPRRTASIESDDVEVERSGTVTTAQSVVGNGTFWAGSTSNTTARQEVEDTEPAGKRLRVR
ncbi:hypothetical protein AA0119_g9690 [Alternaria tenuissima]|jgi:minor histocompatibility antigen H13|uniref:Signal peptide peptidase n=1 Tax=Alternaria tenuissima TaxID=119927 RepID=A0A4Q4P6K9_9PLEO|nr:hypothetical protein AA0115_g11840 [Alternaria tenuissima]RYN80628.1 hypothetical protein AA0120_g10334 [Alternaria tenuissima]RYN93201.1 hypothetical protein AA0119_g9690 [Alternaria tenuissima]RYO09952.1 hypothetical protein AA0121_g10754 [Alternaria tenuissima]RYO54519.1 hypothetical protein AA0116_g10063 [Alternaria tenuissima]